MNLVSVLLGISPGVRLTPRKYRMDLTEGFETSAKPNLTPGKHPEELRQNRTHVRVNNFLNMTDTTADQTMDVFLLGNPVYP
jgi:hypothetical protein